MMNEIQRDSHVARSQTNETLNLKVFLVLFSFVQFLDLNDKIKRVALDFSTSENVVTDCTL